MKLEFLGTAGYHPSEKRHTSCAYIPRAAKNCDFVLDAGTGFFRLIGRKLPPQLHIFLSHAHLDHVSGLTYLLNVLLHQKTEVTVYGAPDCLKTVTNDLFDSPLFPLPFNHKLQPIEPGQVLTICNVKVTVFPLTHPGGSLAYRLDWPNRSLAYVTDTAGDGRYVDFIRHVDLLIHERNFSDDLHEIAAISGHTTSEQVIRVALQSQAKRLAITHFNPLTETEPLEEDSLLTEFPDAISARDGLVVEF
ncbi:MAG: MBL fold metallo-hydrolase [Armatimonadota bacterium]|nr:MBL fold metallo-hydrolase [Armatimonadota bacterium]